MSDQLDPLLRSALSGDDGSFPESLHHEFATRVRARRRANMFGMFGATAAVIVVVVAVAFAGRSRPAGDGFATLPSGTPTASSATGTPACTTDELAGKVILGGGAAGSYLNRIAFIDTSTQDCFVQGRPSVVLITADGKSLPASVDQARRFPDDGPLKISLQAGIQFPAGEGTMIPGQAYLGIEWHDCNTSDRIAHVVISMPDGPLDIPVDGLQTTGQAACGGVVDMSAPPVTIVNNWQAPTS
jgi:hypothetical protein